MIGITRTRALRALPSVGLLAGLFLLATPAFADRYTSPSYTIDASTMNNFGGQGSSSSYKLVSSGGESIIGNGTSGSYKLGAGYVSQLEQSGGTPSLQLAVQPSNLNMHYEFDENAGMTAYDSSQYANHASIAGTPSWTTGKLSFSPAFNAGAQTISIPSTTQNNIGTFTMSFWVKTNTAVTTDVSLIDKRLVGTDAFPYSFRINTTGKATFFISDGTATTSAVSVSSVDSTSWQHVTGVATGTEIRLYVNGILERTITNTVTATTQNSRAILMGSNPGGTNFFNGTIDHVKLFSRVLSDKEIAADYAAQNTGQEAGLTLGTATATASKQLDFDSIVRATADSGYSLAISQDNDLSAGSTSILDFSETFDGLSSGTPVTTVNTAFTSVFKGSTSTIDVASATPVHGNFARNVNPGATNSNMRYMYSTPPMAQYYRAYYRFATLPATVTTIFMLRDSLAATLATLRVDTTGSILLKKGTVTVATTTTKVQVGQWFRVELFWDGTSSSQTLRLFTGANVNSETPTETISGAGSNVAVTDFALGIMTADANTLDMDEVGARSSGWVGPVSPGATIPAISGSIALPVSWAEGATKGLGFSLSAAPGLDSKWVSGTSYAAFPATPTTFYTRNGILNDQKDVINMRARLDIAGDQAIGEYKNNITIVGTTIP